MDATTEARREPLVIQGGMGVAVSGWRLARAVSMADQLGVVSGTALDVVLARRLQCGDPGGHMRRALAEFPDAAIAQRILDRYFIPGGKLPSAPFRQVQALPVEPTPAQTELVVAANFVEVFLAGEGHHGLVGVNYLEKIQTPTLPSLYGAMLAGIDYVLMGAGIPRMIPGVLDRLSRGEQVDLPIHLADDSTSDATFAHFDPNSFGGGAPPALKRPKFIAIVASATLASMLARKATGRVDGFVVEGPTAGGHNAPPRGEMVLNERGEPVYGPRDDVDLAAMRSIGLPFWLAGSYGGPDRLVEALACGAAGVQVGTAFAFCSESGLSDDIKRRVLARSRAGDIDVLTDPAVSPTGFPFKVLQLDGSMSEEEAYKRRHRKCDLGFLRQYYRRPDGTIGWRCPGEPTSSYVHKGGEVSDTVGRKCICNALLANVDLGQARSSGEHELPLVTCGDDVANIAQFAAPGVDSYSANDVIRRLLARVSSSEGGSNPPVRSAARTGALAPQ
jgi:nitronate monooxygenase